jgi:GR25 family glycosyltransferase involved in LPS biosynthesis
MKGSKFYDYKIILSSLFGRGKFNKLKELGCTISHLYAMRRAIYEPSSYSKYALIIEDDVQFLFNVDWDALTATAPINWGIIQLFNSNKDTLKARWNDYLKQKRQGKDFYWVEKWPRQPVAYWSTCAYLINKEVMMMMMMIMFT